MCTCRSYNLPEPWQTDEEVILTVPEYFHQDRKTICVDRCIAPAVLALWEAHIWTQGCCCGHNTDIRWVIVDRVDRTNAETVLTQIGDPALIYAWELIGPNGEVFN